MDIERARHGGIQLSLTRISQVWCMHLKRMILVIAAVAGLATPVLAARGHADFAARIVAAHNDERARSGLRSLDWNRQLAREAQEWADHLAARQVLEHADRKRTRGAGENLWMGTAGYYTLENMMDGFIEEKRHFRPGRFPEVSRTGNWADVGHYTQIIWPTTQEVGCAIARGSHDEVLVCRYWPAGNWVGHSVGVPQDRVRRTAR